MSPLIHELYELSDNTPLFDHLRKGGELAVLGASLARAPAAAKGRKTELLAAVREAVVPALQAGDLSQLDRLIGSADTSARIAILGELILTLSALEEGNHAGGPVDAILKTATNLALDVASELEANPPQDANDPELLLHGIAMREWAHLFAGYYGARGKPPYEAELLMIRARATNCSLTTWAHLVGAAMIEVALALEPLGKTEMAAQCYYGVRMDLRYLLTREDVFPPYERGCGLYWLQRACEERLRLMPDDADAKTDLKAVRKLRKDRGFPDATSAPRFGPIARTYLDRIPYLARIVRDLETSYDEKQEDQSIAAICERYGCLSSEVEFYVSAIGSYYLRSTVLAGVHAMYDEPHEEVFAALDYLKSEGKKGGA